MSGKNKQSGSLTFAFIAGLVALYLYIQVLSFNQSFITNQLLGIFYFILFGIHEATHIILSFLPAVFVAASGSLSEILFTLILVVASIKARSYLATSFSLLWMMLAMSSAGRYMADAKNQAMPLIGPGSTVLHDWNYVFAEMNLLEQSTMIGDLIRYSGYIVGAVGVVIVFAYIVKLLLIEKS